MSNIIIDGMEYILTETNYTEWYKDFKLELDGAGLGEYIEKDIEIIIIKTITK